MRAVTNSGPLLVLAKLYHLHILPRLYDSVLVPNGVYTGVVTEGAQRGHGDAAEIDAFLHRYGWSPQEASAIPGGLAGMRLGLGEREAISLAWQEQVPVLLDDRYARHLAEAQGLTAVGSLGILVAAYGKGILSADALDELLPVIEQRSDIWIHPMLCRRVRARLFGR